MRNFTFAALAALTLTACHHEDKDDHDTSTCSQDTATDTAVDTGVDTADTSVTATCTDSTGTHNLGDSWTCPDGCNTCTCTEADVIASTDMACDTGDTAVPPDTGTDTGTSSDTGSGGTDTSTP